MYHVAKLSDKNRDIVFSRYAFEFGNNKAIVEKDFWVTLVLDDNAISKLKQEGYIRKVGTNKTGYWEILK